MSSTSSLCEAGYWLLESTSGPDFDHGRDLAHEARRLAVEFGTGISSCAPWSQIGTIHIEGGKIDDGVPLLDEAMAGALAGEGQLDTVVFISCQMIHSCSAVPTSSGSCSGFASDRFIERYGCPFLNATCRANYGGVLFVTGEWNRPRWSCGQPWISRRDAMPPVRAEALARLAELRLAQGRVEEAERLVAGFEDHEATVPVCARIHLLGASPRWPQPSSAGWTRSGRAGWRAPYYWSCSGRPRSNRAGTKSRQREGANSPNWAALRLQRHGGPRRAPPRPRPCDRKEATAKRHLHAALREFVRLGMPFETARTRLLIAQALRELEPELAEAEARAARHLREPWREGGRWRHRCLAASD